MLIISQAEVPHLLPMDECITVMAQDWKSLMWETLANVPSYGEWLLQSDQHSAYEHHNRHV